MPSLKCTNCNKTAMFIVGPEGQQSPLCLDCYCKFENIMQQRRDDLERYHNYLISQMEAAVGLPGILPRVPERQSVIHKGDVTLNNINVSNSEIGVLNTGNIENLDATINILRTEGNTDLASMVKTLTEAIIKSDQITSEQKNQSMELLAALSEEAVAPRERRKKTLVKIIISQLSDILVGAAITTIWNEAKTVIEGFFGL